MAHASSRPALWRLRLAEFDYEVTFRTRLKHQAADAFSCILTYSTDQSPLGEEISTIWDGPQDIEYDEEGIILMEMRSTQ